MRKYIDDFITLLSSREQKRVGSILADAKVGKEDIQTLAKTLASLSELKPPFFNDELMFGLISSTDMQVKFREIQSSVDELFGVVNFVSLLIESENSVLQSEINSLSEELNAIEKMADNYAFLLSEGGAFNYAFLEPFSDETGRDSIDFTMPDRASQSFGSLELASVNSSDGSLILSQSAQPLSISLFPKIISANVSHPIIDSGIEKMLNNKSGSGWRYVIGTSAPITSYLPGSNGRAGAQMWVEFVLSSPSPISQISFSPMADEGLEILSVIAYADRLNEDSGIELLHSVTKLNKPYTLRFPLQSVAKFKVLINQPTYQRVIKKVKNSEKQHERIWKELSNRMKVRKRRVPFDNIWRHGSPLDRYWHYSATFSRDGDGREVKSLPRSMMSLDDHNTGPLGNALLSVIWKTQRDWIHRFTFRKKRNDIDAIPDGIFAGNQIRRSDIEVFTSDNQVMPPLLNVPEGEFSSVIESFSYRYSIGLESVKVSTSIPGDKGFFISRPLEASGQIGQIRIKTSENNYRVSNTDRDSNIVTSVEYSIARVAKPMRESDWMPIMPIGSTIVEAERFFPDGSGNGFLRFSASKDNPIFLYKNGYTQPIPIGRLILSQDTQSIIGITVPVGTYTSRDFFTVTYTPVSDFSIIDLSSQYADSATIVSAHDENGAGEGYIGTGSRNIIDLNSSPYIDSVQVAASSYSDSLGMVNYQPITVVLDDGTNAINLTNYGTGTQAALPDADADSVYFIHSGNTLIFNKTVDKAFRVYYNYLQNNVRVRVVLRVNTRDFVSPSVDFFHVKAKTRRSNLSGLV